MLLVLLALGGSGVLLLVSLVGAGIILFQQQWFQMVFFQTIQRHQHQHPQTPPPTSSPNPYTGPRLDGTALKSAAEFFQPTHIWETHLRFSTPQWKRLGPRRIPPIPNWIAPDGSLDLRNPHASRAGVAGTLGFDLPWSSGTAEIAGVLFTNAAIRFKGNGTLLEAMSTYKKSFKLDLNEGAPGRSFARQKTINLHNLVADRSCIADTLGYEFYRDAGVPAPRTTFTRVFLTLDGQWEHRLLGLYLVVENPDSRWANDVFGTSGAAVFKPVTNRLFADLGDDWDNYEDVYAPRDPPSKPQRQHLIELCRLVSKADQAEFDRRLGSYLDLDATARFLAAEALLSNYDSILMNGQNFILWLDPRSFRFGFSPWDLDHGWGEFGQIGSIADRERASLFHPWVGSNRFLERLFACPEFQTRYRRELTRYLDTLFVPDRLHRRIDQLADVLRPAVQEESEKRLSAFEAALASPPPPPNPTAGPATEQRAPPPPPGYRLKHFIQARSVEARAQLEGRSQGIELKRGRPW